MNDDSTGALAADEYRRVRDATRTFREELVVRLAGELGLRPREIERVRLADGREREVDGTVHRVLDVPGAEPDRVVPVPEDLWDSLAKYARERDRKPDEPVFDVSARRLQMLASEVGERVEGVSVSTRALRRTFGSRALEAGVDPRVVRVAGGWASLDTVADLADRPDEDSVLRGLATHAVAAAKADAMGGPRTGAGTESKGDAPGAGPGAPDPGRSGRSSRDDANRALERAVDAALDFGAALESSETRADVEQRACEALTATGYDAAWVLGRGDEAGGPTVRASAGVAADVAADQFPSAVTATLGSPGADRNVEAVGDGDAVPGLRDRHALVTVPVRVGDTAYGALLVAADDEAAFESDERRVLGDVGRRLGQAIAATTRRRLLRDDAVVELSFRSSDERSFLVETAREWGCSFELEGLAPVSEEALVLYLRVSGNAPESVVDRASDAAAVAGARLIRTVGEQSVVELVLTGGSVAVTLTRHGGKVTAYAVDDEGAAITAEFPTDVDVRGVVEGVTAAFPDTEFVAKREVAHPVSAGGSLAELATAELTDRQRSVLRSAYLAGYFDWPRGTTAEELADALGISSPTLHNHLRKAQRTVLDELFEERSD